ncbi:MAG: M15 family metallopeptidase [Paludibacteraceae bacterium]|nr:M15 family metallopeptidase [Paludibacteraceae bacterium]
MKTGKLHLTTALLTLLANSACTSAQVTDAPNQQEALRQEAPVTPVAKDTIPYGAECLIACYPQFVKWYKDNCLILSDGSTLVYDDGQQKTHTQKMDNADPEDMFSQPYDTSVWHPKKNYDPGRIRNEAIFKHMYGKNKQKVLSQLVKVDWFGQKLLFTAVNGAADSLRTVAKDLAATLPPTYQKYFSQSSTFNWRAVRGSNRLSAHSYGITIDICTKYSDFWRWSNPGKEEKDDIRYVNRIPHEIIRIFEKHGFVSGARWYHYDTMHFEYRPDLLRFSQHKKN